MDSFNESRRTFIKQCVIGGVTVYSAPLLWQLGNPQAAMVAGAVEGSWKGAGRPRFRNDGIAKVTGQKVYGRDYRAVDMPGWPDQQGYAYVIRASSASRRFLGIDLDFLPASARPSRIVTAAVLEQDGVKLPQFYGEHMLVREGRVADYLGHGLAILLFEDFASYRSAKSRIQFNDQVVRYGDEAPGLTESLDPYASWRILRVAGEQGEDLYSPMRDGLVFPEYEDHKPVWNGTANAQGSSGERAAYFGQQVNDAFEQGDPYVLNHEYRTQIIDPMAMEPEAFNGWYDAVSETFHTVATTQSPQDFQEMAVHMLAQGPLAGRVKHLVVHSPYIGGGFGGKDHTIFPYYGLVAAMYASGPMRLANDRFEQFQTGLKRHPFTMKNRLAVNRETLKIEALTADMALDAGGRVNFSPSVASVGATALQSVYYVPRNDLRATAYPSRNPDSGSMRGYGTLQSMAAMECMIHEAAEDLGVDPFEFRKANLIRAGQRNTQGAIPIGDLRYGEILDLAQQHPIWTERDDNKARFESENPGFRHGVGFGIATKDYGTGAVAPSAALRLSETGELRLQIGFIEMGTGTQTSQAVVVSDHLGSMADEVVLAETDAWQAMQLEQTDNPYIIAQQRQDEMAANPRWTPVIAMASSASMSSYFQSHVTGVAAGIIFRHAIWPAAVSIWTERYFNGEQASANLLDHRQAQWKEGRLSALGFPPLSLAELAQRAHAMGLVVGVMCHSFNRWAWVEADFDILAARERLPLDALALQYGSGASPARNEQMTSGGYHLLDRQNVRYPDASLNNAMVTYYAPCAALVEVSVNEGTGEVALLRSHSWLEAGKVIVPELVQGQIQGGLAMGLGHALLEYLPPFEDGAGNGTWNLNRYHVPRAHHVGVWTQGHTILPPLSDSDPSKGIAEVVMIPVVPALVEAVYQTTGHRFYDLPMSADKIKEVMS